MGMHIDPARRDQQAVGVDHPSTLPGLAADRGNSLVIDRQIPGERRPAGPVDDYAAANDDVVHGWLPPLAGTGDFIQCILSAPADMPSRQR